MKLKCKTIYKCESDYIKCPLCGQHEYVGGYYDVHERTLTCMCGLKFYGVLPTDMGEDSEEDPLNPEYYVFETNEMTDIISNHACNEPKMVLNDNGEWLFIKKKEIGYSNVND